MNITQRLMELDPSLTLHNEGSWSTPLDILDPGYTSFNDAGVETETGEFLYAMTRILKPTHVLETGTHWGIGTAYIASALKDNKKGFLDTVEFLPEIYKKAAERVQKLELTSQVRMHLQDVKDFVPKTLWYGLILLDTEPQTRFAELVKLYPYLQEGGFVFIHDLHRHMHQIPNDEHGFAWPYGPLPQEIRDLVKQDKLRPIHFPTPRGLTGFYKVSSEDYKFSTLPLKS